MTLVTAVAPSRPHIQTRWIPQHTDAREITPAHSFNTVKSELLSRAQSQTYPSARVCARVCSRAFAVGRRRHQILAQTGSESGTGNRKFHFPAQSGTESGTGNQKFRF